MNNRYEPAFPNGATSYLSTAVGAGGAPTVSRQEEMDAHDGAHRVTEVSYPTVVSPFVTPAAKYFVYDAATVDGTAMQYAKGRLAEAYTGSHATDEGFSYPTADEETVYQSSPNSGGWYWIEEQFYPNGAPSYLTNDIAGLPAITYGVDGEGRANGAVAGGSATLVNAASTNYGEFGLSALALGSGDADSYSYSSSTGRMTGYTFTVGTNADSAALNWASNGEMASMQISDGIPGTGDSQYCDYSHDDMGRIAGMASHSGYSCLWQQSYALDPFGNVTKSASAGRGFSASYNLYNQISGVGGVAGVYDYNGNLRNDPTQSSTVVNTFDADNKMVSLENTGITYDALDRAVEGASQEFVWAPDGTKLAVMSGQTLVRGDVPLPGGAEAVYNGSGFAYYRHADLLGSSRLSSNGSAMTPAATAYAPYGEEETSSGAGNRSFTGKKQDIASGTAGTDQSGQYL